MNAIAPVVVAEGRTSVRSFRSEDAIAWDDYVRRSVAGSFFHLAGWRTVLEDLLRHRTHYLIAERAGLVVGVLPLAETRSRFFGHALISLPAAVYGGPLADDDTALNALVDAADALGRELGVDFVELRSRAPLAPSWAKQDLYVTFSRNLDPDAAANMAAIPRKQRAMVRKGIANGLRSCIDERVDRFFDLYADNMHRHGTPPFARRYFERLREVFADACEVLTVVDAKGVPVSSVLSFYFRDEVLPYYAGDTTAARDLAANDFKYWELMRRACERGIRVFDYGRSKRGTGSFDFKKNWGFVPTPLAYEFLLLKRDSVPQNNPANPRYAPLIAVWRRLPRPLVNAMGPHIVRHLG